jgi:small subunit ribosomal protein S3
VGQKTHPTGFRTGVNKSHNTIWFSNYGVYSEVLKEDYKVRKLFEKKIKSISSQAGIARLEIQRKVSQLELIIHAARPKTIAQDNTPINLIVELEDNLKKLITGSKQIRIKVMQIEKAEDESLLVAQSIADQLEKRVAFRKAIQQTTKTLQKSGVKGFKIQVAGRLNGAEIARTEWAREGRVPLQTLRANISYAAHRANTIYGVLGVKVWIFNKEVL